MGVVRRTVLDLASVPILLMFWGGWLTSDAFAEPLADPLVARPVVRSVDAAPAPSEAPAPSGTHASQAPAPSEARRYQSFFHIAGSQTRAGVGVAFEGDEVHLFRCAAACVHGHSELALQVPPEARALGRTVRAVQLEDGEQVVHIRYGEAQHYSFLVRGAARDEPGGAPRLLVKGWNKPGEGLLIEPVAGAKGNRIVVRGPVEPALCGRMVPSWIKRFEPQKDRFVPVRMSPLSGEEMAGARPLATESFTVPKDQSLLRLVARGGDRDAAATDGERTVPWDDGYEFVVLGRLDSAAPTWHEFILELAPEGSSATPDAPAAADEPLFVVTEQTVYALELDGRKTLHKVTLPGDAPAQCVALVQPLRPHPIVEVMALGQDAGESLNELVARLNSQSPGSAGEALLLRGRPASEALASVYAKLSEPGQRHTEQLAPYFAGPGGAELEATIALHGSPSARRNAVLGLGRRGEAGIAAARRVLPATAPEQGDDVWDLLLERSPAAALSAALDLLAREDAAGRSWGRDLLRELAETDDGRPLMDELLASAGSAPVGPASEGHPSRLERGQLVELVRAFSASPRLLTLLEALALGAGFEQAYRLTDVVVAHHQRSAPLREALGRWLLGQFSGQTKESAGRTRGAALSVRTVEAMVDAGPDVVQPARLPHWTRVVPSLLGSDNVRVRVAGTRLVELQARAHVAAAHEAVASPAVAHSDELLQLLRKDAWPSVRAGAAEALAQVGSELSREELVRHQLERAFVERLRREKQEQVRRALARSAPLLGGESLVKALRRALARDASYAVRADAALALGRLCDTHSVPTLTEHAQSLASNLVDDGPIHLGLSALSALVLLSPPDLEQRLAPLLSDGVPALLQARVASRLQALRVAGKSCQNVNRRGLE